MAAISTAITAGAALLGVGTSLYGLSQKNAGDKAAAAAAQQQAQFAAQQTAISGQQAQLESENAIAQAQLQATYATGQSQASAAFAQQEADINIEASQNTYAASATSGAINQQIIALQQQVEGQRRTAMELTGRRDQMEQFRQAQRARSASLVAATGAGSQFGSGLQGAYGQISGQSGVNLLGIRQNLALGRNIFDLNAGISQQQMAAQQNSIDLAYKQAGLQTREAQLKAQYAQTTAGATTGYYTQSAANTTAYSAAKAALQTQYASAGGQIATQQGNIAAAQGQSSFGQSLFAAGPQLFQAGSLFAPMGASLFGTTKT